MTDGPRDRRRGGRRLSGALGVVGVLAVLVGAPITLSRAFSSSSRWGVALASVAPWAIPFYLVALLACGGLCLRSRWWAVGAAVALAGLLVHLVWVAPAYTGRHDRGPADLTVLELNCHLGTVDPDDVATLFERFRPDVVVLTEITPSAQAALVHAGAEQALPYRAGEARPQVFGTLVLSRYRLHKVRSIPVYSSGYVVDVQAPRPFTLVAAHLAQGLVDLQGWRHDLGVLADTAAGLSGPRIVTGDFNATLDHADLRTVLRRGRLSDAAQDANSGWQPTWPGALGPRLLRLTGAFAIDHVLVGGGIGVVSTRTAVVAGTDHRALIAALRL